MWISEVFESVQGEGRFVGVSSGFIRTSGCNLRCVFCDTPYTSWKPEGQEHSFDELFTLIEAMTSGHMVVTGGEPLLTPEVIPFTQELKRRGYTITIETAGTVHRPEVVADLMSISPKLRNSVPVGTNWEQRHEVRRHRPEIIRSLTTEYDYQFKFVIDQRADINEVEHYLEEFPHVNNDNVYLMPQGIQWNELYSKLDWLTYEAEKRGWQVTPRKHIELFGNTRGT
ncbi:7-carboxy-7-deazaguanine synthase QueE [Planctomicrobium sp. SH527]|uniref:7-carboxy-7-deazaguanine synthase QueE n=1 Tax=Planctomicrobium sp. SH527 TaxID=3448123 RepID=UPI003F5BB7FA